MKLKNKIVAAVGVAAAATALAVPAFASPAPPVATPSLVGTWINTNAASNSVKQISIQSLTGGRVAVDAFGSCSPTLCEWGRVVATNYATSVSGTSGTSFQTNQRFLSGSTEWSRTQLFGSVARTTLGLRLTVREFTAFEDGTSRKNYTVTETFAPGKPMQAVTKNGLGVAGYPLGHRPAMNAGLLGTWKPAAASSNLAKLVIGGTVAAPAIHAYGVCSPTPCDWGTVSGITYGTSISTLRGTTELAPYRFSFKNTQLLIKYTIGADDVERLTVSSYNEFTDGSGRSNYTVAQTLVRA